MVFRLNATLLGHMPVAFSLRVLLPLFWAVGASPPRPLPCDVYMLVGDGAVRVRIGLKAPAGCAALGQFRGRALLAAVCAAFIAPERGDPPLAAGVDFLEFAHAGTHAGLPAERERARRARRPRAWRASLRGVEAS
jgi:hypothetical protein